jgi:hypothetical protein
VCSLEDANKQNMQPINTILVIRMIAITKNGFCRKQQSASGNFWLVSVETLQKECPAGADLN